MTIAPETLFLLVGYTGSVLGVAAFLMKAPIRLRQIAIGANVALATYGSHFHINGLFLSNSILVPLNIYRLRVTSDATMLTLSSEDLIALYEKNPQFGIYLVRTITARLLEDISVTAASTAKPADAMIS